MMLKCIYPDDYQHEYAIRFNCSQIAIGMTIKRLAITQKSLSHPKADDIKRSIFIEQLTSYEQQNSLIINLDESGFKSHAYRAYGYADKGNGNKILWLPPHSPDLNPIEKTTWDWIKKKRKA